MKVKDIIQTLQQNYKGTDEIIVSWFDKDYAEDVFQGHDEELTEERWIEVINLVEVSSKHTGIDGDLIMDCASDIAISYSDEENE